MHPKTLSKQYFQPSKVDTCLISFEDKVTRLQIPNTTSNERNYCFSGLEVEIIEKL